MDWSMWVAVVLFGGVVVWFFVISGMAIWRAFAKDHQWALLDYIVCMASGTLPLGVFLILYSDAFTKVNGLLKFLLVSLGLIVGVAWSALAMIFSRQYHDRLGGGYANLPLAKKVVSWVFYWIFVGLLTFGLAGLLYASKS